jgi:hypothetical protein
MPAKKAFSREAELDITARYLAGESSVTLGRHFSIAPMTVSRILRDCGACLRTRSESSSLRAQNKPGGSHQNGRYGVFQSVKVDAWLPTSSSYEYVRMQQHEDDPTVLRFERCKDRIRYHLDGRLRHYTPDLTVWMSDGRCIVEEIKPADLRNQADVLAKESAAISFYQSSGTLFRMITEDEIGREYLADFPWDGFAKVSRDEINHWQRNKDRERATAWAQKKRASTPMTDEQRQLHARRTREYQARWNSTATEEQKAAKRSRAAELMRIARKKQKPNTEQH